MSEHFLTATLENLNEILEFENSKLNKLFSSEIEQSMARWSSPWRQESLEHYLKLGWSFLLRDKNQASDNFTEGALLGYFLAQPLLFLDAQTQSLWVEHLSFNQASDGDKLCEMAYKLAREKHFQKVYFPKYITETNTHQTFKITSWTPDRVQVLTTKVSP